MNTGAEGAENFLGVHFGKSPPPLVSGGGFLQEIRLMLYNVMVYNLSCGSPVVLHVL